MADRINVTTGSPAGGRSPAGPRAARFIIAGQTQFGPTDGPRIVSSLSDYVATFGVRSGGANMFAAAEFFFGNGGGELVVQRAYGPSAVLATIALDTNKITVTSRAPGAYYHAITAAFTASSCTLTLVKPLPSGGTKTVTYSAGSGGTAADLAAKASIDPDVTVTVSSLPSGNVSATPLASGTDDFANVNWATVLGNVTNTIGSGAMAVPGVNGAAAALAAAATPRRVALLTPVQTDAYTTVATAQGSMTAANKQNASYAYPWGAVADGTGGLKVIDGTVYAGTLRNRAITVYGLGASSLMRSAHRLVKGFTPLVEVTDAAHTALNTAGVVTIRTLANGVGVDVWATAEGVNANAKLTGMQYRDMVNACADLGARALDGFVGLPASALVLGDARAALIGVCEQFKPWLVNNGPLDPGYKVVVAAGDVSDNRIQATISLKFLESVDYVDFTIVAASADQSI